MSFGNPFRGVSLNGTWFGKAVQGVTDFFGDVGNLVEGAWNDLTSKGVSGVIDDFTGNTANRENIEFQKEYNEQVFNRADTQYQRTVADLRAAGLSSQLASGAPSTVAGQTSAPQRAVGNESQAMERLIGMVTSMKQANASVNLTNAQADKVRAETSMVNKELGTYGERTSVEIALKRSQSSYNTALSNIALIDGQYKASYWDAQINDIRRSSDYRNALTKLAQKDQSLRDAQIEGQYQSNVESRARVEKINQEKKNLEIEYFNLRQDFQNKLVENQRLNAQTELLLKQAASAALDYDIKSYDFGLSKDWNIRTSDQQTKLNIFGLGSSNLESLIGGERLDYSPVTGQKRNYGQ